ncbi:MAG TPA: LLM class F420-dependent oxidoreductase [Micromonosporaceae bacterium]|nr:LLM class F420-dependent oxidoreductase [Micromonosporaceae bacterium]
MSERNGRVRIAVQLHPQHGDISRLSEAAVEVERLGADLLYTWDHFFPLYGDSNGAHFECWTMLAAWAALTSRVELGPLVTCTSYRNPNLLADMARTVDRLSNGRLVFGIGAGWFARDYQEYGYPFGTRGSRLDALGDALRVIDERWARLNPPPVRRPPVLIGGVGPQRTLPLVARYADVWHAMFPSSPDELVSLVDVLERRCTVESRDPASIEYAVGIEPDALDHDLSFVDDYLALGFRQFTLGVNGPEYDLGPVHDWLAWRDEVNARVAG